MKRLMKLAVAFGLLAMAGGALAQDYVEDDPDTITTYGTDDNTNAGTEVENIVSVTYEVNGVEQEAAYNTDDGTPTGEGVKFVVDRVILINVSNMDTDNEVTVTPDEDSPDDAPAYLTFDVVNDSNATLDMILLAQVDTTAFTPTNVSYWREDEVAGVAGFDATDDELTVTGDGIFLGAMDEEEVARIYVMYDMPSSATALDAEEADVTLLAIAYENDGDGLEPVTEDTNAITNEDATAGGAMRVDTVFGDLDGPYDDGTIVDGDEDGMHSATGTFVVGSATITVSKSSVVISDPFNLTTNPKAIPGAEILYCIEVTNAGGEDADNVSIKDPIPTGTTYVDDSIEVFTTDITCAAALVGTGDFQITDDDADDGTEATTNSGVSGNSGDPGATPAEVTDTVVNTTVSTVVANDGTDDGVTATIFRVTID